MLQFRPHHFLCTLGFEGKGYSQPFVRNFKSIADSLRARDQDGDQIRIQVVADADSICAPCPNRVEQACASEARIHALDQAHAEILGIRTGEVLTWGEAKKALADKMTVEAHQSACAPCAWRSLGLCESALRRLKQEGDK